MACLDLADAPVLVVGGGEVAVRKVGTLLEAKADVTVVSLSFHPALDEMKSEARQNKTRFCSLVRRAYRASDLKGQRLVFACTDNPELNRRIADAAKKKGVFVNVAAPPEAGDFQVPASVRHGSFVLSVSTGGASASLAAYWRKRLEKIAGPEWGAFAALLEERREKVQAAVTDPQRRRDVLRALSHEKWVRLIRKEGEKSAAEKMDRFIDVERRKPARSAVAKAGVAS